MQNGSFQNLCEQIYCNQSVIVGKHMVDNHLQNALEDLEISPCEFCQMINYETNICECYWAHCEKVNTLDEFVKCLKARSEQNVNRLTQEITNVFGVMSEIENIGIVRNSIMENTNLNNSEKVEKLFKCFFTTCLVKATEDEIYSLHKHIAGEIHALGCKGINVNHSMCDRNMPPTFMNAHTCFNQLDLMIHVAQLDTILLSFEMFRESVNSQFAGVAYDDS